MASDGIAKEHVLMGISIAFTCLSVFIVGLRIYTRAFLVRSFGKDDCAMIAALVFVLSYLATIILQHHQGMGTSGKDLTLLQMTRLLKSVLAIEVLYYLCVNAVKISILLFYLRLPLKDITRRLCKGTIAFLATLCTVSVIVVLAQCIPLRMEWDITGNTRGHCINATAFFYMTSSTNIVVDVWILLLPVEFLIRIERPVREKTALIIIFALGASSCICSIVRLYTVKVYAKSEDPFVDAVPINTWSMVEINLGIYSACLPALKALVFKIYGDFKRPPRGTFHLRDTGDTKRGGEIAKLRTHSLS